MSAPDVGFLISAALKPDTRVNDEDYPFRLPPVRALEQRRVSFASDATVFVGENGSGKSTLIEAIAIAAGFNAEGGSMNHRFSTRASESDLHRHLRLVRSDRRPKTGYFLRAESYFNVATNIEELDRVPAPAPLLIQSYGGKALHEQSHGESVMALVRHRFGPGGLYILDEPETGLSVRTQFELLRVLHWHASVCGSQLIIATHSPILMALPNALIYQLSSVGIAEVAYEHTEAFLDMRAFLSGRRPWLDG